MTRQMFVLAAVSVMLTSCASTRDEIHVDEDFFVDAVEADRLTGEPRAVQSDDAALQGELAPPGNPTLEGDPMSNDEINDVLVGNTFPLEDGGIYYHSDTIATIYRNGESEQAEWQGQNGEVCHSVSVTSGIRDCFGLFRHTEGDYIQSFDGTTRLIQRDEIFPGNRFD
ncbi:hypothetical protein N9383_02760 [Granulosicoccus sp.]|nr:hypothetical protein [Granulosicoccus sp.]